MTAASRSLATALWRARFASGLLRRCYTTNRDTTERYGDGDGLYLRVLDPGRRIYWVYRYRINKKEREISIGPYPEVTLADARAKHAAFRKTVVSDKRDPLAEKRAAKAAISTPSVKPTFGEVADAHVAAHKAGWRNATHAEQWRSTLGDAYCSAIRDLPVDKVDTTAVLSVLKPIWNTTPETASRLRGRIEAVLASAQVEGHIPEDRSNPARWKNWLDRKLPNPKRIGNRGHHAALAYVEVPAFVARLRAIDSMTALPLEFLILTATRTDETLEAPWREFDLKAAVWSIPPERMKNRLRHDIPLSARALDILAEAEKRARKAPGPDSFVFPGARPRQPLSGMALARTMHRMGVNATRHGFRTSFRTWASEVAHAEFEVAEAALSHQVGSAVSRAYNRTTLLER